MFALLRKSLPLQLLLAIGVALLVEPWLGAWGLSFFYTMACVFKDLLMMVIPFVVFGYFMASLVSFEKRALGIVLGIFVLVTVSNALSVFTAYGLGRVLLPLFSLGSLQSLGAVDFPVEVLWALPVQSPLTPGVAMVVALILGGVAIFGDLHPLKRLARRVRDDVTQVLRRVFIPLLPVYVFGFTLRLQHEGTFSLLMQGYGRVFLLTLLIMVGYVVLAYAVAARFRWRAFVKMMIAMLPAGLTAFTTMSSAATLPVTLEATEKVLGERDYADFVIPLTANNHTIGDGISIAFSVLALMGMTGQPFPDLIVFGVFTFYYCITKFSAAGVPGGGILIMLPVIESQLGASGGLGPELLGLLTTLYVLQDPIITAANVLGNGAFAVFTEPLFRMRSRGTHTKSH